MSIAKKQEHRQNRNDLQHLVVVRTRINQLITPHVFIRMRSIINRLLRGIKMAAQEEDLMEVAVEEPPVVEKKVEKQGKDIKSRRTAHELPWYIEYLHR